MKNQFKINSMLKAANDALLKCEIVKVDTVVDGYDSAIAAFGPAVVQSGLMPALAFYCAAGKEDKRKTDKSKIIKAISMVLFEKYGKHDEKELFNYCLEHNSNKMEKEKLTEDIVNASIALKIMVRTFIINESNE